MNPPLTAAGVAPAIVDDTSFFGHPRGLSTLFFTEMWERFSYYGMRALLILFMTRRACGRRARLRRGRPPASIYGLYTSMVYMAGAARRLDRRPAARAAARRAATAASSSPWATSAWPFPSLPIFYAGLLLIVIGTGLLKGERQQRSSDALYAPGDARRDAGFSIFYMGINLGRASSRR